MTGRGSITQAPYRRLKWLLAIHLAWLAIVLVLGAWWGQLILEKGARIAELERRLGLTTGESWERTQRMIYWESGAFVLLLLASTVLLALLYWREARRARSLQAFFASVTHELRTPLTSIRLQAESIGDSLGRSPLVDRLLEDTQRLESQVERTLELARIEGGGRVLTQPVPLRPWFERMLRSWKESYGERIRFSSTELPDVLVQADTSALQIVLRNLLENSMRHSGRGQVEVSLEVRIGVNAARGGIELWVRDDGTGFSGDGSGLGRLFEKGPQSQGAGVGLYLVRVLMERMGGRAEFTGQGGKGFETRLEFEEGRSDG